MNQTPAKAGTRLSAGRRPNGRPRGIPGMAGRYCIFVSAGDRHKIDLWLKDAPNRKWNLIVAYYGDDDGEYVRLSAVAKRAFRQKGGKFQNLRDALASDPGLLDGYDYVWV